MEGKQRTQRNPMCTLEEYVKLHAHNYPSSGLNQELYSFFRLIGYAKLPMKKCYLLDLSIPGLSTIKAGPSRHYL